LLGLTAANLNEAAFAASRRFSPHLCSYKLPLAATAVAPVRACQTARRRRNRAAAAWQPASACGTAAGGLRMGADPRRTGFGCGPLQRRAAAARRGTGGRRAGPSHRSKACDSARLPVHDGTTVARPPRRPRPLSHDAMTPWYNDDSDFGSHGTSSSGPQAHRAW
jgi:hypothetical protein